MRCMSLIRACWEDNMSNSDNPRIGKEFQQHVHRLLSSYFGNTFTLEYPIAIGNSPKAHRFDIVSEDCKTVVECKCYTWTSTGNIPSAKMMGLNEAVFYMSYLPSETLKIIAIRKSIHPTKTETLAEYYNRINGHLLSGIRILEIDDDGAMRWIR